MLVVPTWDRRLASTAGGPEDSIAASDPRRGIAGYLAFASERPVMGLAVFEEPARSAPTITMIEDGRVGSVLATVGGGQGIIVFGRRPGWFEVALWAEPSDDWRRMKRAWIEDK